MVIDFIKVGGASNADWDILNDGKHVGRIYLAFRKHAHYYNVVLRHKDFGFYPTLEDAKQAAIESELEREAI